MKVKNVHFHGIHPTVVYWTGKQQLLGKMDHQVRHDVKKNLEEISSQIYTWYKWCPFAFPGGHIETLPVCITSGKIFPTLLTAPPPDGEGTVEWKQGRDVVAGYDSHDSSTRTSYCPGSSHTGLYFLHSLKDTSHNSSTWKLGSSSQASRCKELEAFFSSLLSTTNVFLFRIFLDQCVP